MNDAPDNTAAEAPKPRTEPETDDAPPTLFDSHPNGVAGAAAAAAGLIAVGTICVEILTDRWLARVLDLGIGFVSLPLGVTSAFLGAVCWRVSLRSAAPGLALGALYWILFLAFL